jgi:hypothetical protein
MGLIFKVYLFSLNVCSISSLYNIFFFHLLVSGHPNVEASETYNHRTNEFSKQIGEIAGRCICSKHWPAVASWWAVLHAIQ